MSPTVMVFWRDLAMTATAVCAAIVGVAAAWRVPRVRGCITWVCRRMVAEPLTVWFHHMLDSSPLAESLRHLQAEVRPNGGSSLRDVADRAEARGVALEARLDDISTQIGAIEERLPAG